MGEIGEGEYGADMAYIEYLHMKFSKTCLILSEQEQRKSDWRCRGEAEERQGEEKGGRGDGRRGGKEKLWSGCKLNEKL